MKKITLLFFFIGALAAVSYAQPPEYGDLNVYYADGNFEKLLKVAERYTVKDDTRKDALPYLYLSKTNLEISKGGELLDKYPRAFKDAIKYANKCIKYDTNGDIFQDELEHFTQCKEGIFELMQNQVEDNDFGRLSGTIPLMEKLEKQEIGTAFLKAVAKYRRGDKSGFKTYEKLALEKVEKFDFSQLQDSEYDEVDVIKKKKVDRDMFLYGVIQYAKVAVEKGEKQKAISIMKKIQPAFKDNEDFIREARKLGLSV